MFAGVRVKNDNRSADTPVRMSTRVRKRYFALFCSNAKVLSGSCLFERKSRVRGDKSVPAPSRYGRDRAHSLAGPPGRLTCPIARTRCLLAGCILHAHLTNPNTYLPNPLAESLASSLPIQKFPGGDHRVHDSSGSARRMLPRRPGRLSFSRSCDHDAMNPYIHRARPTHLVSPT